MEYDSILSIQNLSLGFKQQQKQLVIHGLDLDIPRGKTFALLGESGCGKSVTAHSILQLLPENAFISESSKIIYENVDLLTKSEYELQKIRGKQISMIFQDPMTALNPVITIGKQISEILLQHSSMNKSSCRKRAIELLEEVGIDGPEQRFDQYSHQFSGGQKQRIMIAMALSSEPNLLIADEPTTALDVTTQAKILYLLNKLQKRYGLSILLITHDIGVASLMGDVIGVMYGGHLVEVNYTNELIKKPLHPYTQELIGAIPSYEKFNLTLKTTAGVLPIIEDSLSICRYVDRCPLKISACSQLQPKWHVIGSDRVRCNLFDKKFMSMKKINDNALSKNVSYGERLDHKNIILSVRNLSVEYANKNKFFMKNKNTHLKAVDNMSFELNKGKTLAIVGESGSGKTSTGKAIVDLVRKSAGKIYINGIYLSKIHHRFRRKIQIVFQDVHSSLNPKLTILDTIIEGLLMFEDDPNERENKLNTVLSQVGLSKSMLSRYPHQLSGGQRQRVSIARSLILSPEILILDEPTSALDVSIQAQILTILKQIQREYSLSYVLISHDISVVSYMADEIVVMYKGKIVECGKADEVLKSAKHPYTQDLLNSVPENVNFTDMARMPNVRNYALQGDNVNHQVSGSRVSFSSTHHVYYYAE